MELSAGTRHYLEIRLLMSLNRKYVLLDEPFTGVEPIMIERIADLIVTAARKGSGILLTDHYQHYAIPFVDDAYVMVSKQCRRLDPSRDRRAQLYEHGYVPE